MFWLFKNNTDSDFLKIVSLHFRTGYNDFGNERQTKALYVAINIEALC